MNEWRRHNVTTVKRSDISQSSVRSSRQIVRIARTAKRKKSVKLMMKKLRISVRIRQTLATMRSSKSSRNQEDNKFKKKNSSSSSWQWLWVCLKDRTESHKAEITWEWWI